MLSDKDIRKMDPIDQQISRGTGDGNGLTICIASKKKGGTKHFEGRFRFKGSQDCLRLGVFDKQISIQDAREKWRKIYSWFWKNECLIHPKFYKEEDEVYKRYSLNDAANLFIKSKSNIKQVTLVDYKRKLFNQVLPVLGEKTPLFQLQWENGGREKVEQLFDAFKKRKKFEQERRTRNVLYQVFELAIQKGWMPRNTNPATKNPIRLEQKETKGGHPTITWDRVPKLMQDINANECNGAPEVVYSVKFLLMTFLRVGALVRMEWNWYNEGTDCWVIPSETAGLKRKKGVLDRPHYIPVTKELHELMDKLRELTGHQKYVFFSPRGKRFEHICVDAPNNHLKRLKWKGLLVAHGWRKVPLTAGQDVLKVDAEIIQRQMGHLLGDQVRQAYDQSLMLDERREFMNAWCTALVEQGLRI